jgi:hypothetical protein
LLRLRGAFTDELVQGVGADDMDVVLVALVTAGTGGDDDRVNLSRFAFAMVTAEVAGVGGGLVKVGLGRSGLALELEDEDGVASEDNDIRSAGFHGELVFQDCAVLGGAFVLLKDFTEFGFQFGDGIVPGMELFG